MFSINFPEAPTISDFLFKSPHLAAYKESGITQLVAQLAAERLCDSSITVPLVLMEAAMIVSDLEEGKDSFANEKIPQFALLEQEKQALLRNISSALVDFVDRSPLPNR